MGDKYSEMFGGIFAAAMFVAIVALGIFSLFGPDKQLEIGSEAGSLNPSILEAPRPIAALDSVFIEELTWMEVRDALRDRKTTAIVATGGIEQNGPYLALGKHNYILRLTTERIARQLGNALVAPIVVYVPEGHVDPPSGHMRYPGTISVREDTFEALLSDITRSLISTGFQNIILIGDSGGNQKSMARVAKRLSAHWPSEGPKVHFIAEYYDNPRWDRWLEARGYHEVPEGFHDGLRYSLLMMLYDPQTIRADQRQAANKFSINGVPLSPIDERLALAEELVNHQVDVTVAAIRASLKDN